MDLATTFVPDTEDHGTATNFVPEDEHASKFVPESTASTFVPVSDMASKEMDKHWYSGIADFLTPKLPKTSSGEVVPPTSGMGYAEPPKLGIGDFLSATPMAPFQTNTQDLSGSPPEGIPSAVSGALGAAGDIAESFTSPVGASMLVAGGLPGLGGRVATGLIAAQMAKAVPEQSTELGSHWDEMTQQQKVRSALGLGGTIAFSALSGAHVAAKSPEAPMLENASKTAADNGAPLTAQVLQHEALKTDLARTEDTPTQGGNSVSEVSSPQSRLDALKQKFDSLEDPSLSPEEKVKRWKELSDELGGNPVPESKAQIDAQMELTADPENPKAATLVTKGSPMPDVPEGMETRETNQGTVIVDPNKADPDAVAESIDNGGGGRALGFHNESKPDSNIVVQTSNANGVPVLEEVANPDQISDVVDRHKEVVPNGTSKVVHAVEALDQRAANREADQVSGNNPTSIKNAITEQERAARGLPPAIQPARQSFGDFWDQAMKRIDADPKWQDNLIEELKQNPRALGPVENAALLQRQIDLQNRYRTSLDEVANASDSESLSQARTKSSGLRDDLYDLYEIDKRVGTAGGQGLVSRKMMADEAFNLVHMESELRSVKPDASPLTEEEAQKVKAFKDKIDETQKRMDEHDEEAPKKRVDEFIKDATKVHPEAKSLSDRIIESLTKKANDARARLKERLARTSSGIDPTILSDVAIIGAEYIAKGIRTFGEWSSKIIGEFGDKVKPYLEKAFEKASDLIDSEIKTNSSKKKTIPEAIKAAAGEGAEPKDVGRFVQRLSLDFVRSGITDREALIDKVHEVLKDSFPDITRRQTMDAISGYGDFKLLDKETAKVQLRQAKGEMQQLAKLEDIQNKQPLKKTGIERREMSDEERRLQKQVNEAKKKHGVVVTDPAKQLKSAQDTVARRLKNRINDLRYEIETGEKIVKGKTTILDNEETAKLKAELEEVKKEHDEIFKKRDEESDYEKSLAATKRGLQRSIDEYERRIKENDFGPRPKKEPIKLDQEAQDLKSKNIEAKQAWLREVAAKRLEDRSTSEKVQDSFVRWHRGFLLSNPVTLAKLTAAAIHRLAMTPIEEGVGGVLSHAPGISSISERAPRQGGFSSAAEAKALTEGFMQGMRDSYETLTSGESGLSRVYGKGGEGGLGEPLPANKSLADLPGRLHAALKAPVKRAEFARSFQKRMEFEIRQGNDPTSPEIQTRVAMDAYKDANRSIFMQDNAVVSRFNRFVRSWEEVDKSTGKIPARNKAVATSLRTLLPIVKVPSNIVAEAFDYSMGSVVGGIRARNAIKAGIENLKPEEADAIMRQLKKGSIGAAMLVTGYYLKNQIGGFYSPGEKRKQGDVKPGFIRIAGYDVPKLLLHSPAMETLQLGASVHRISDQNDKGKPLGLGYGVAKGALGLTEEMPFIGEMIRAAKAYGNPRETAQFFGELGKSIVIPSLVQGIAEYEDQKAKNKDTSDGRTQTIAPYEPNPSLNIFNPNDFVKRNPSTLWQHFETGIPGLRETVPPSKHQ